MYESYIYTIAKQRTEERIAQCREQHLAARIRSSRRRTRGPMRHEVARSLRQLADRIEPRVRLPKHAQTTT